MHRCLEIATQGRGHVGGNPLVGAVLVRGETILEEGVYMGVGTDHAERSLLKKLEQTITPTDRLYVNLEPCCHTGNTPPCTDVIIKYGVRHVIVGMKDPDDRVAGQGIAALRAAGVQVIGPVCRAECERLNRGYVSLRTKGRPYITLKKAQTSSGKTANSDGSKLCITTDAQNEWSHTYLRTTHDAILIGVQTVITDNPELTIRLNKKIEQTFPQPKKIIFDPSLKIPQTAKLIDERTIIVTKELKDSKDSKELLLRERGPTVLTVPMVDSHFDWDTLWKALSTIHYPLSSILVEGGPKTWDAFTKAGLVDEEVVLTHG